MSCEMLFLLESKTMHGHTWFKHINTLPDRSMQTNNKYRLLSIHACDTLKHNRNHMKRNVFHMCDLPCQGFQMLEFFAGKGNLSKCMKSSGYTTASFDILYSGGRQEYHNTNFMDINSSSGFAYSVIESIQWFMWWQCWGPKRNCFNLICVPFNHALFEFRCIRYTPLNLILHGYDWMIFVWAGAWTTNMPMLLATCFLEPILFD